MRAIVRPKANTLDFWSILTKLIVNNAVISCGMFNNVVHILNKEIAEWSVTECFTTSLLIHTSLSLSIMQKVQTVLLFSSAVSAFMLCGCIFFPLPCFLLLFSAFLTSWRILHRRFGNVVVTQPGPFYLLHGHFRNSLLTMLFAEFLILHKLLH